MKKKAGSNKFILYLKNCWPILAYAIFAIVFLFPILQQQGIPFKYDWAWPIFDMKEFWKHLFDANSLSLLAMPAKYASLILGLSGLINLSTSLVLKIFLIVAYTLAGYGFFLFINKRVESKLISFIAGLAYAFSPYIFIRTIVGFIYAIVACACSPFFLYFYFSHKKKNYLTWILLGFLFSLIFAQVQAGLLISLILFVNLFVSIFSKKFLIRIKTFAFTFLAFFVVNIPWLILSYVKKSNVGVVSGNVVTTLNFIASLPHSFRNIFMLSDHQITVDFFYPLAHDKLFLAGWLIVWLTAACAILSKKSRELVLTLIISCFLVLPFLKGPAGIFGRFYLWFYNHCPQIAVFRETYHFEFLYVIALSILFAIGLDLVWQKISRLRSKNYGGEIVKTGLMALFAGSALFIIAPYFTFDFAGYFKLQQIPPAYENLDNFFQENKDYCHKIYYPPGTGFLYFKGDRTLGASNSDVLASSLIIPYLSEDTSVLNLPNEEMFYRNQVVSQFYEKEDNGEFVNLLNEGGIDCVVLRTDIKSEYFKVSNLWREKDSKIYGKWINSDVLALAKNKQGLVLDKQIGENIYIFRPQTSNLKPQTSTLELQNLTAKTAIQQFNNLPRRQAGLTINQLPITDWATEFDYYKDGWSRGRYAFWRKMLFAQLQQDFLYTDKAGVTINGKIDQRGEYEVWTRTLTGGGSGEIEIKIQDTRYKIQKDAGEEKFVWKKLGDVDIANGNVLITNISGENAIADIVLIKK